MTKPTGKRGIGAIAREARKAWDMAGKPEKIALALIAGGALAGFLAAFGHLAHLRWPFPANRPTELAAPPAPDPGMDRGPGSPFSLEALGPRMGLTRLVTLEPPFDAVDSIRFRSGELVIQLLDLEGPASNAVCLDSEQLRWGCGRQARAALYNLVREGSVTCRGSRGSEGPNLLIARCEAGGADLALAMARSGFARAQGLASPVLRQATEEAQTARKGLWNGDWSILR